MCATLPLIEFIVCALRISHTIFFPFFFEMIHTVATYNKTRTVTIYCIFKFMHWIYLHEKKTKNLFVLYWNNRNFEIFFVQTHSKRLQWLCPCTCIISEMLYPNKTMKKKKNKTWFFHATWATFVVLMVLSYFFIWWSDVALDAPGN